MIYLIGGSSSVGKTTMARSLSKYYDMFCLHLDDFTKGFNDPELEFFTGKADFWDQAAQELFERLVRVTEKTEPYLHSFVSEWVAGGKSGIIEGEKIHPRFMEKVVSSNSAKGIFLIETDREQLYQTLQQRSLRFRELSGTQQWKVAEVNQRYGLWLKQEAKRRNLIWENAQPWETLVSRVLDRFQ